MDGVLCSAVAGPNLTFRGFCLAMCLRVGSWNTGGTDQKGGLLSPGTGGGALGDGFDGVVSGRRPSPNRDAHAEWMGYQ